MGIKISNLTKFKDVMMGPEMAQKFVTTGSVVRYINSGRAFEGIVVSMTETESGKLLKLVMITRHPYSDFDIEIDGGFYICASKQTFAIHSNQVKDLIDKISDEEMDTIIAAMFASLIDTLPRKRATNIIRILSDGMTLGDTAPTTTPVSNDTTTQVEDLKEKILIDTYQKIIRGVGKLEASDIDAREKMNKITSRAIIESGLSTSLTGLNRIADTYPEGSKVRTLVDSYRKIRKNFMCTCLYHRKKMIQAGGEVVDKTVELPKENDEPFISSIMTDMIQSKDITEFITRYNWKSAWEARLELGPICAESGTTFPIFVEKVNNARKEAGKPSLKF